MSVESTIIGVVATAIIVVVAVVVHCRCLKWTAEHYSLERNQELPGGEEHSQIFYRE